MPRSRRPVGLSQVARHRRAPSRDPSTARLAGSARSAGQATVKAVQSNKPSPPREQPRGWPCRSGPRPRPTAHDVDLAPALAARRAPWSGWRPVLQGQAENRGGVASRTRIGPAEGCRPAAVRPAHRLIQRPSRSVAAAQVRRNGKTDGPSAHPVLPVVHIRRSNHCAPRCRRPLEQHHLAAMV